MILSLRQLASLIVMGWVISICSFQPSPGARLGTPMSGAAIEPSSLQRGPAEKLLNETRIKRGLVSQDQVQSLLIRTSRTLGGALPEYETIRMLWPDRFQRVGSRTHTILGQRYWQQPTPSAAALEFADRNTRHRFAETALIFLLRPLPGLQVKEVDRAPDRGLEFTDGNGFRRVLVFAPDLTLKTIEEQGQLTQGRTTSAVARVLTVDEHAEFKGIAFPGKMTERIGPSAAAISISEVQVNRSVAPADFVEVRKIQEK